MLLRPDYRLQEAEEEDAGAQAEAHYTNFYAAAHHSPPHPTAKT